MLISLSRTELKAIATRIALTTGSEDPLVSKIQATLSAHDIIVAGLTSALAFLELGHMSDDDLQRAIDSGLDDPHGIGKGKAKLALQLRAALAKAEGSI